jgi:hypothetical protein
MTTKIQNAVGMMYHLVMHAGHGYSQPARDGNGVVETVTVNGIDMPIYDGDRDCSSAVLTALRAAAIPVGWASYTGNMLDGLKSTGEFDVYPATEQTLATLREGDILLGKGHVAMSGANNDLMEFSLSETGGISGRLGDQTGREAWIHPYYNFPWTHVIRHVSSYESEGQEPEEVDYELMATAVLQGAYGNGEHRKEALGAHYEKVQEIVNARLKNA